MSQTEVLGFCNLITEGTSHDFYHPGFIRVKSLMSFTPQALQGSLQSGPETSCHSLVGMLPSACAFKMEPVGWGEGNTL